MQIEFKKEQIVKNKPQSILIDYVEYKLSLPKWMIKNNSFIVDNNYTYWVFNLENKIENDEYRSASNDAIYYSLIKKINNREFD